ncbi:TolC family protein [Bacteroides heparinolyticus]|uniref:TolC family protein n=1 Tax=Prevotella heparinolytica TaxID=28113 RepID=UPI003F9F375C
MKKKNTFLLVALGSLLSSCGVYTKYKPATSVPDNLYGEYSATEDDSASLRNMEWRELFTDPQLQALIEQALENNTDYQTAQLRVEEAEATLLSAKLAFLPSFALARQGTVSSFDGGKATQTYSLPVTAGWELDVFGRMRNAKKQSKALYAQSLDYRQAVRTRLISGVANTYYTLLMLDEQLVISQQMEEAWKETLASTRALMKAGMRNEAAVSQIEGNYYQVQTSVLDLKKQISQVENSLALLLAETPGKFLASAVGSLTQPLFARGQVIAQYRIARARQEEAALAFRQTLLKAGSEVNDALTAWQTSIAKSELLDKQVTALLTAAKSTSLLMEHGNTTYLEVLTARQTLLNAQLSQTANRFAEIQSLINLYQALGGGEE